MRERTTKSPRCGYPDLSPITCGGSIVDTLPRRVTLPATGKEVTLCESCYDRLRGIISFHTPSIEGT